MDKILIIPGWSYTTEKWKPLAKILEGYNLKVDILTIPGLHTPIDRPWTLDDYVAWLKNIVEHENNKITLLGHSNGGRIALSFAANYPKLYDKLILIDSAGIYHNEIKVRFKRFVFKLLAKTGKIFTSSGTLKNLLYKAAQEKDYKDSSPVLKITMNNLINIDLANILPEIYKPTLIIWGKLDKMTPLSDAKLIHERIVNSKLVIIEEGKHSPQFTNTQSVSKHIEKFIKQT